MGSSGRSVELASAGAYGAVAVDDAPASAPASPGWQRRVPWRRVATVVGVVGGGALAGALSAAPGPRHLAAARCDWDRPDFVVVGGGAAGSVAAAALADARKCAVVLEAGGPYRGPSAELEAIWRGANVRPAPRGLSPLDVPRLWGAVAGEPALHWEIPNAVVARVLGGCGAHNAMLYVHATPRDVAAWNASGWTWDRVDADYAAVFRDVAVRRAPSFEGDALAQAFLATASRAGIAAVDDFNACDRRGDVAGPFHVNVGADGRRASARAAASPGPFIGAAPTLVAFF